VTPGPQAPDAAAVEAGRRAEVVSVTVTEAGRALAARLPYPAVHGRAADAVPRLWGQVDGLVLFLAVGAATRILGPLLSSKHDDPAVVCVDEAGRFAVALCGGHRAGANSLARRVAGLLGATEVVTTGTDRAGLPALDELPGLAAEGDVAGVARAMLDGHRPRLENPRSWPLPPGLEAALGGPGPGRVVVSDEASAAPGPATVVLRPPSLVAGVGASTGADPEEVAGLLDRALAAAGLAQASLAEVATLDRRRRDPALAALGRPVRAFSAAELASVAVPHPSPAVDRAVGTPSVAEAAALAAAGPGAQLAVPKLKGEGATVAVARRARPRGSLSVVGLGPGHPRHRTPAAEAAVRHAEVVVGYSRYLEMCADLLGPHQEVLGGPLGEEAARAALAASRAAEGRRVAVVSSGDPGVYAMASLVIEACPPGACELEVVPGVSASLACAALLGAPLGQDHAVISLSDHLVAWGAIEQRLRAAAQADLVVALYNPRSSQRTWQLPRALELLGTHRSPSTPVGLVTNASREGQQVVITSLGEVDASAVTMDTCVVVGASTTKVVGGRMVTPRGQGEGPRW